MGREIRRVPPNWQHPQSERHGGLQPMHDETFEHAAAEWKKDFAAWERGERSEGCSNEMAKLEYWEWANDPPDRAYYRPWKDEDATWFQVWETVTEGTPITPPFATLRELEDHLVAKGTDWEEPWCRKSAAAFCRVGWVPSLMWSPEDGVVQAMDIAVIIERDKS